MQTDSEGKIIDNNVSVSDFTKNLSSQPNKENKNMMKFILKIPY